ncbi:MAG: glycosyltransferase, partial [Candidatus Micrarchaeota archaeon]
MSFDYLFFPPKAVGALADAHLRKPFDRVIAANPPDSLLVSANFAGALLRVRVVNDFHDPFVELVANHYRNPLVKAVAWFSEALALATAWKVITVSPYCVQVLRTRFPRKAVVVNNCASASFRPSAKWRVLRRKYGKFALFSGSLIKQNGVLDFLQALDESKQFFRSRKLKAVIAGGGGLEDRVRQFIEERGLKDFVSFVGRRERAEMADWIAASEAVVVPFTESPITRIGTPNKLYEALKLGRLVIASDLPGVRSVAGEAAVYYPAGDVKKLGEALKHTLSESKQVYARKAGILSRLSKELVWEKQEKKFVEAVAGD